MERVVAARGQPPVDLHQVAHTRDLGRQNDPVVGQPGRLRQLGGSDGALDHRLDHDVAGGPGLSQTRVRVHQLGQDRLIQ